MKLTKLEAIETIKRLNQFSKDTSINIPLNEIELILYSTNLCLFSMRILRNEINVKNRTNVLNVISKEVMQIANTFSNNYSMQDSIYYKKNTKSFFKKIGLKPKHIKTN